MFFCRDGETCSVVGNEQLVRTVFLLCSSPYCSLFKLVEKACFNPIKLLFQSSASLFFLSDRAEHQHTVENSLRERHSNSSHSRDEMRQILASVCLFGWLVGFGEKSDVTFVLMSNQRPPPFCQNTIFSENQPLSQKKPKTNLTPKTHRASSGEGRRAVNIRPKR